MEKGSPIETLPSAATRAPKTVHAEIQALRERAAVLEQQLTPEGAPRTRVPATTAVAEAWQEAAQKPAPSSPERVVEAEAITLKLTPEQHDNLMAELIGTLQQHGVAAAIRASEAQQNPHLIDDFHRILVEYVHEGLPARSAKTPEYQATLGMTLFEINLPRRNGATEQQQDPQKEFHTRVGQMEQLLRSLLAGGMEPHERFSFEIANPIGSKQTSVFIAMPNERASAFEKQALSLFPTARITALPDDYNIFEQSSAFAGAEASLAASRAFSLRNYTTMTGDPQDGILAAFARISEHEGAALQCVVTPDYPKTLGNYRYILDQIKKGTPIKAATALREGWDDIFYGFTHIFSDEKILDPEERPAADDPRIKSIEYKLLSPATRTTLRIVAGATDEARATSLVHDLTTSCEALGDTIGNQLKFTTVPKKQTITFAKAFSYREASKQPLRISTNELATFAHLPNPTAASSTPETKQGSSRSVAAPVGLGAEGTLLGYNRFRGEPVGAFLSAQDRVRHLYVVGQTGTGKSALLKNLVAQDIKNGDGVCFIDPHGNDVQDILSIIPQERLGDVIYFDPGATEFPFALNMLEFDPAHPEQKTLVVDELLGIFRKLFGAVPESMGPAFEQYFRNAALLVMEDQTTSSTLVDIARIFTDEAFRMRKLAACQNPIVSRFWQDMASKATGEQGLENYAPYITNKFDAFTTNEIVRPIISQQHSSFNFREIMDTKKIFLVNLAKGRIGEINANLFGLIIVGKFLLAALSRADSFGKELPAFYLHIDEFQNFATPSIATILSEARKYKLSLTIAHQFIAQLPDDIKNAVFGNVGSLCAFRIGADDAQFLEKQFAPTFSATDLMGIDNYHAHVRLLVGGRPMPAFDVETVPFISGPLEQVDALREMSYIAYGRPRAEVEEEINR